MQHRSIIIRGESVIPVVIEYSIYDRLGYPIVHMSSIREIATGEEIDLDGSAEAERLQEECLDHAKL